MNVTGNISSNDSFCCAATCQRTSIAWPWVIEDFRYDELNRLVADSLSSSDYRNTDYADNGNIEERSDIGIYNYGAQNAGPHAVTSLSNTTGTLLPTTSQAIDYTVFNKVSFISQGNKDYFVTYGPDRLRTKTLLISGITEQTLLTKYYAFGDFEKETDATGTRELHYIAGGDGLAAVYVKYGTGTDSLFYIMQDHLGSLVGAINAESNHVYRQSFDAWGRERNFEDWTYTNVQDEFPFLRGYTGHEHLKWFGLINMNGRMYDPALCRFLSPDPYVQMPDNSQNFNRYSYCYNNPLVYTDPSGKFVVWDSWLVGFVDGFFSSGSNRFDNAWDEANLRAGNDIKIWGGLFSTDENKEPFGQVWELFSRFTWQLPQTIGGFGTAHSYNTLGLSGGVEEVEYLYGATVLKTRNNGWGGVTQGSFIVGDNSIAADANNPLFQHEYGHYLQSQSMGWAYYPRIGIPSIRSKGVHDFHDVEQDANRRAFLYFNQHIDGFQDDAGLWDNKGWDFWRNPLNLDGTKTRGQYLDYSDPNQINSLDVLRARARWYDHASWLLLPVGGPVWVGLINSGIYNR